MKKEKEPTAFEGKVTIRRLGITHGVAKYDSRERVWKHVERPPWFEGRPQIEDASLITTRTRIIDEGEYLYDLK